ncbi:MAG: CrfX protein, partial [Pseudomonas putida]
MPMHDPFEESLRDLLKASPSGNDRDDRDDAACLGRVLKTANRQ